MAELEIGDVAPEFDLPGPQGASVRLSSLRGKVVALYFYPKDDTTGCTQEAIDFSRLKGQFEEAGAVVVGISPDSPKRHANFARKYGLTVTLASDPLHDALQRYGVWGEKTMFGRKYMGVVRTTYLIGRDGRIVRVWKKVKVEGHAEEVLEAARLAG